MGLLLRMDFFNCKYLIILIFIFRLIFTSSIGYLVLAILFVAVHFCGEDKIEGKLNTLEEKITSDNSREKPKIPLKIEKKLKKTNIYMIYFFL